MSLYHVPIDGMHGRICACCKVDLPTLESEDEKTCDVFFAPGQESIIRRALKGNAMQDDEVMPPPMFDMDSEDALSVVAGATTTQRVTRPHIQIATDRQDRFSAVDGYIWTTHNRFKGIAKLDYSMLTQKNCPSPLQAARHAFSRSALAGTLGVDAADLAGHIMFVPTPPWGGPVMIR